MVIIRELSNEGKIATFESFEDQKKRTVPLDTKTSMIPIKDPD